MAKHTPGPWVVTLAAGGTGRPQIAHVVDGRVQEIIVQRGGAIAPRNAFLIAAAPDLEAACYDALAALEWGDPSGETGLTLEERQSETIDSIRALLTRINGGETE